MRWDLNVDTQQLHKLLEVCGASETTVGEVGQMNTSAQDGVGKALACSAPWSQITLTMRSAEMER